MINVNNRGSGIIVSNKGLLKCPSPDPLIFCFKCGQSFSKFLWFPQAFILVAILSTQTVPNSTRKDLLRPFVQITLDSDAYSGHINYIVFFPNIFVYFHSRCRWKRCSTPRLKDTELVTLCAKETKVQPSFCLEE